MNLKNYYERVDDFFTVEGLKDNWAILSVATIFFMALWLRYLPENGMQYLQALDPYMIYRYSQHLAYTGSLPPTDFLQYFPYNAPVYLHNLGNIFFPAIFYWMGPFLVFENYLEWAQFYPALMGAASTVMMYLFGREVFDEKVGVAAAFFLAVIPGAMRRTSAGFFEKEPIGTFFMMTTFYLFARAWMREDYLAGIASGVSMAFFSVSWGGSRMMWLLLPLIVGSLMFIDEEIHRMIVAYTPTVLIGAGAASALNYGKVWWTEAQFIGNFLFLGFLWSRYLVEEFELVKQENLKYYTPSISAAGILALLLSPLYSDWLAAKWMKLIDMATQSVATGDVIAQTVAENTAPGLGALITSLGSIAAGRIHWSLSILSNVTGVWPLMMIGISFLGTGVGFMLLRKYEIVGKEISDFVYFGGLETVYMAWSFIVIGFFLKAIPASVAAGGVIVLLFLGFITYLEEEASFKLITMIAGAELALQILLFFSGARIAYAMIPSTVLLLGGILFLYYNDMFDSREIEFNWLYVIPLLWVLTNLLGAVAKSRLIFLATFSVAFAAGYGFTRIFNGIGDMDFSNLMAADETRSVKQAALILLVGLTVLVNISAGYASVQGIGGSPGPVWDNSLNYMEKQTPPGSVIMSWWDYGYHFESIGRRPSIANGWNSGYYTQNTRAINMPLADFFTHDNPLETPGISNFLEKHSVDYIVLDHTMIGKYAAVSTISNKAAQLPNETVGQVQSMTSLSTSRNIRKSLSRSGNLTLLQFSGSGISIYAPVEITNTSVSFSGAPSLQRGSRRLPINCVLTENGTKTFDVESRLPYCIAEDPYYSLERGFATNMPARAILVPKSIQDATLVQLYLEDGTGLDWAKKVPQGSNSYVKMWKVTR
ncbi:MAG: STT3 domain-containing protein [Candidatus Nanosalina sp.]